MNITYEKIKIADLKIEKYNRPVNISHAKKIAAFFNEKIFGLVVVSERNGKYIVLDGQHRTVAATLLGIKEVMCMVFHGLTYEEEARIVVESNNGRKAFTTADKMNALKEANDPDTIRLYAIVGMNGLEISSNCGYKKIPGISTIRSIYFKSGPEALDATLRIITDVWGGDQYSLKHTMIDGMNTFLCTYNSKIDTKRLISKLQNCTSKSILAEADGDMSGGCKKVRVARAICRQYNKNAQIRLSLDSIK